MYEPNPDEHLCHELSNCPGGHEMQVKTRNCRSNPNKHHRDNDVKIQNLLCLGHWPSNFPGKHFAIVKSESDYKCAVSKK